MVARHIIIGKCLCPYPYHWRTLFIVVVLIAAYQDNLNYRSILFLNYAEVVLGDWMVWLILLSFSEYMGSSMVVTVDIVTNTVLHVISSSTA